MSTCHSGSEGLTRYANRMLDGPLSAFELIFDNNSMLTYVQQCTEVEAHGVKNSDEWKLPLSELKTFIFLLYVQRVLCGKNRPTLEFWDKNWRLLFFQKLWVEIAFMKFFPFDMLSTRLFRLLIDKCALISAVWNKFIENCIVCYKTGENITVNKQLFQTKTCCRFTQYLANKPDKLGIKFWLAIAVESKCIISAISYQLHKDFLRVL